MAPRKANPAPQTEVLPGPKRDVAPEDLAPPNEGLPIGEPAPDTGGPIQQPPIPTEPLDQPFTIDDSGERPPETPPEPEVTHDPLMDTKAKLTKVEQELAEQKKLTQAVLVNREFSPPQQQQGPPPEWANPGFLPDEQPGVDPNWPSKFVQRQFRVRDIMQEEQANRAEMQRFARDNPDFPDYLEDMRIIAAQNPGVYEGPRSVHALYERAKTQRELTDLRTKQAELMDRATAAGAKAAKTRQPIASPRSGGGSVPRSTAQVPPDFKDWTTAKQKEWLIQHNMYGTDT